MVTIVADTTAGLPREMTSRLGIPLIPQLVIFGDETYHDDTELDTAAFLAKLRAASALPKTAAPPPPLYNPIFEKARREGDAVIVVAPSAKVSGTVRSATLAAQEFPGVDIRIVDSQTIAGNLGSLVLMAHQWALAGLNADAIVKKLENAIPRGRIYFMVATLDYLVKGGRIGAAKGLVGELLQVKPILTIQDSQVTPFEQRRTKKRAMERIVEIVANDCPRSPEGHLSIMQGDALADAELLMNELSTTLGITEIPIYELPPAIVVHGGPGALAVGFFTQA